MGIADKFDAAKDKITGKIEETVGKTRGDNSQVMKGKVDQGKGAAKDKMADAQSHLNDDAEDIHTDDTEGGASTPGGI